MKNKITLIEKCIAKWQLGYLSDHVAIQVIFIIAGKKPTADDVAWAKRMIKGKP